MSTGRRLAILEREAERLGVMLDADALDRFARYLDLLAEWNERAGLTTVIEPEAVQRRHFAESLALLAALRAAGQVPSAAALDVVDVGTGAGFPGVPLRIAEPAWRLTLVESSERRCAFLVALVERLGLDGVRVVHARAEEAGRDPLLREAFDLVVSRALAALPALVEYALPLLRPGGLLAAPKGSRATEELVAAGGAIAALGGRAEPPLVLPLPPDVPAQQVLLVRRSGPLDARFPRRAGVPQRRPLV